jgi:hypothetical protein
MDRKKTSLIPPKCPTYFKKTSIIAKDNALRAMYKIAFH